MEPFDWVCELVSRVGGSDRRGMHIVRHFDVSVRMRRVLKLRAMKEISNKAWRFKVLWISIFYYEETCSSV